MASVSNQGSLQMTIDVQNSQNPPQCPTTLNLSNETRSSPTNPEVDNNSSCASPRAAQPLTVDTQTPSTPSGKVGTSSASSTTYADEWERFFSPNSAASINRPSELLNNLRSAALNGNMRNSRFRSVGWRLFLGVISPEKSCWSQDTKKWREEYSHLTQEYIVDPRKNSSSENQKSNPNNGSSIVQNGGTVKTSKVERDNPLSQDQSSVWHRFFSANEARREIQQDVVRTFPELEFFRDERICTSMTNILFCYSQISYVGYRQGMHEILAPLIFVLHCDHVAFQHASEIHKADSIDTSISSSEIEYLLDSKYLEHDAFSMFFRIMEIIDCWYFVKETSPARVLGVRINNDNVNQEPFQRSQDNAASCCAGVERLNQIQEMVFKKHDLELFLHLERIEIAPQTYGLRWIRLLFGREFPMQDLLVVWDAIFTIGENFALVDYIFVAMHIQVRDFLLSKDFSESLCLLMRYPQGSDVHYIVNLALHFYRPDMYPRPTPQLCKQLFVAQNRSAAKARKVQRNKTSVDITLPSRFKASDIIPRLSNFGFSSAKKNPVPQETPPPVVLRREHDSGQRSPRPLSMMESGVKSRVRPSSLSVPRRQSSVEQPSATELDVQRCRTSMMESAPVTPTQELLDRSKSSTPHSSSSSGTRSKQATPGLNRYAAANNFPDFVEIRMPQEREAEAEVMRELLQLCVFCASELDICIQQVKAVADGTGPSSQNNLRFGVRGSDAMDDTDLLNQCLVRMCKLRNCLNGVDSGSTGERRSMTPNGIVVLPKVDTRLGPSVNGRSNMGSRSPAPVKRSFSSHNINSALSFVGLKTESLFSRQRTTSNQNDPKVVELKTLSQKANCESG